MKIIIQYTLIFKLLLSSLIFAEETKVPEFTLEIEQDSSVYFLKATPPADHHFNLKTPYKALKNNSTLKAFKATKDLIQYNIAKSILSDKDTVTLTLFICDNDNKYCVKQNQIWSKSALPHATAISPNEINKTSTIRMKDEFGFIMNNVDAAFEQSKKTHKPILIDFYAIWCPPCNELDEIVYPSKEFNDLKDSFVLLKLDVDSPVSWKLKSQFEIKGYPTIVIISPQGIELSRIVGFIPMKEFFERMKLSLRSDAATNSTEHLAANAFYREDWTKSKALYSELITKEPNNKEYKERFAQSEIEEIKTKVKDQKDTKENLIAKLEKAINNFGNTIFAMESAVELAEIYEENQNKEKQNEAITKGLSIANSILKTQVSNGEVKGAEYSEADLYQQIAEFHDQLEQSDESKSAYLNAVNYYKNKLKNMPKKRQRGYSLELAYCLWKSGNINKANDIYEKFEKMYPNEFTFYYAQSRMFFHLKDFKGAKEKGEKALQYSYGDNQLRSVENLANIYAELGDKKKGIDLITQTIQNHHIPTDYKVRSQRYIDNLTKLKSKLESK